MNRKEMEHMEEFKHKFRLVIKQNEKKTINPDFSALMNKKISLELCAK